VVYWRAVGHEAGTTRGGGCGERHVAGRGAPRVLTAPRSHRLREPGWAEYRISWGTEKGVGTSGYGGGGRGGREIRAARGRALTSLSLSGTEPSLDRSAMRSSRLTISRAAAVTSKSAMAASSSPAVRSQ
jgi:hypothetical protein